MRILSALLLIASLGLAEEVRPVFTLVLGPATALPEDLAAWRHAVAQQALGAEVLAVVAIQGSVVERAGRGWEPQVASPDATGRWVVDHPVGLAPPVDTTPGLTVAGGTLAMALPDWPWADLLADLQGTVVTQSTGMRLTIPKAGDRFAPVDPAVVAALPPGTVAALAVALAPGSGVDGRIRAGTWVVAAVGQDGWLWSAPPAGRSRVDLALDRSAFSRVLPDGRLVVASSEAVAQAWGTAGAPVPTTGWGLHALATPAAQGQAVWTSWGLPPLPASVTSVALRGRQVEGDLVVEGPAVAGAVAQALALRWVRSAREVPAALAALQGLIPAPGTWAARLPRPPADRIPAVDRALAAFELLDQPPLANEAWDSWPIAQPIPAEAESVLQRLVAETAVFDEPCDLFAHRVIDRAPPGTTWKGQYWYSDGQLRRWAPRQLMALSQSLAKRGDPRGVTLARRAAQAARGDARMATGGYLVLAIRTMAAGVCLESLGSGLALPPEALDRVCPEPIPSTQTWADEAVWIKEYLGDILVGRDSSGQTLLSTPVWDLTSLRARSYADVGWIFGCYDALARGERTLPSATDRTPIAQMLLPAQHGEEDVIIAQSQAVIDLARTIIRCWQDPHLPRTGLHLTIAGQEVPLVCRTTATGGLLLEIAELPPAPAGWPEGRWKDLIKPRKLSPSRARLDAVPLWAVIDPQAPAARELPRPTPRSTGKPATPEMDPGDVDATKRF